MCLNFFLVKMSHSVVYIYMYIYIHIYIYIYIYTEKNEYKISYISNYLLGDWLRK